MPGQVVAAFSYDTEMAATNELPAHIIAREDYAILPLPEKQKLWADFIREGIWSDPAHRYRTIQELEIVNALGYMFHGHGGAMTSFILGAWLDWAVEELGQERVRSCYNCVAIDIQSHSYNHLTFGGPQDAIRSRTSPNLPLEEVCGQISKANDTIERHLGVRPWGLRTPMGNTAPLVEREIVVALEFECIKFVSSWLKAAPTELNSPAKAQPFRYKGTDLWEIPGVGKYDVHFMPPSKLTVFGEEGSDSSEVMLAHYINVLEDAIRTAERRGTRIYVPFVMHPWATVVYDPGLVMHAELLGFCTENGILLRSYAQVHEMLAK